MQQRQRLHRQLETAAGGTERIEHEPLIAAQLARGRPVVVVEGSGENIKVTRPEDMIIGDAILGARRKESMGGR